MIQLRRTRKTYLTGGRALRAPRGAPGVLGVHFYAFWMHRIVKIIFQAGHHWRSCCAWNGPRLRGIVVGLAHRIGLNEIPEC